FHEENVMEGLRLDTEECGDITEILEMEDNSILVGKVKQLDLGGDAIEIIPKLAFHREDVMEELVLNTFDPGEITNIFNTENKNILVSAAKVKKLKLSRFAVRILPELVFHGENVVEELVLDVDYPDR
ncbi:MAG: uncharacterized protein A8A55_3627, partial [Amphiamblys sp. WSBS2006]